MNKLIPLLLSSLLLVGTGACSSGDKTSADAPNTTAESPKATEAPSAAPSTTAESPKAPDAQSVQAAKNDAGSQVRQNQENSDIRAREQRNNAAGGGTARAGSDLQSEVRDKLEANIQGSQLVVEATKNGAVTVAGTVPRAIDKTKITVLAKQIKGVKSVKADKVTVAAASTNKGDNKTPDAMTSPGATTKP